MELFSWSDTFSHTAPSGLKRRWIVIQTLTEMRIAPRCCSEAINDDGYCIMGGGGNTVSVLDALYGLAALTG